MFFWNKLRKWKGKALKKNSFCSRAAKKKIFQGLMAGFLVLPGGGVMPAGSEVSPWPAGKKAAVSLTYDDALDSQIRNALPQLDRYGLRATFFLSGSREKLESQKEKWFEAFQAGHELAAHTLIHPCDRSFSFVQPGKALQDYDRVRMAEELDENVVVLRALGARGPFSFAYPCGQTFIGEKKESYVPLVMERFVAARGVSPALIDPFAAPWENLPSVDGAKPFEELWRWVSSARENGKWVVFFFHGVGGDYLACDVKEHERFLQRLQKEKEIWTAPFGEIVEYLKNRKP